MTQFRHQMRSGFSNGIVSCSWCYFVQTQPISQKLNSVMDRPTDGPTHPLLKNCENASKNAPFNETSKVVIHLIISVFPLFLKDNLYLFHNSHHEVHMLYN